ncbi:MULTISPECIES: monovalent cation/H(+) antiporter subunit G [unclassified Colwellia]|jgi:multicomponent Na+:H+ antiporter subunit G|uniref:monovalent cation/H(+) antiporter subunit G n=1 Tax=unclassified Colwellia TaxID=196834 RepID=UPI0015F52306|nr:MULTISPECIES: monovalent cation/H(+) antiporter subunit G [unclassified Colwellia]MBA6338331.1 monovalent cation/H(+) antiporter subunit G [Colwellia sp. BRX8-7]MBA6346682.1 monovalent cation/H(+) antiporter subunit G [Colwellia sp. BRX8-9]MBA6353499.1 monovalent cation/H(+) antiporter subunit G [Colwellia sp. BRX9-1]MBA6356278.1 monovalent cation/H(+) antiporter subunit G [Colwellia sp. BRX8-3]MBA6360105.1 monovalent cation/H(+) antiporter subunit G [Colwellia sp. BRX8-6]
MIANIFTIIMLSLGCLFFIAGTIGLLRFPDVFCRLHALTKSDNLGVGLITLGLLPQVNSVSMAIKVILVWALLLLTSATSCHLVARHERRRQMVEHDGNQHNNGNNNK